MRAVSFGSPPFLRLRDVWVLLIALGLLLGAAPSMAHALPPPTMTGPSNGATFTNSDSITFTAYDATPLNLYPHLYVHISVSPATDYNGLIAWDVWFAEMSRSGSNWSAPYTGASLGLGTYYWQVYRIDDEPFPAPLYDVAGVWSFSIVPPPPPSPNTMIIGGPPDPTNDNTPTFSFTSDQAGSSFECRLDDGDYFACASPYATAPLPDGSHAFYVRAVNGGRTDPSPASQSFTVDTQPPAPPTITATNPPSPANNNNPGVLGNAEDGSTVRIYPTGDCSGTPIGIGSVDWFRWIGITVTVPDDQTTLLRATATDGLGNLSNCSDPFPYAEDSTAPAAPTITATDPPSPSDVNTPKVKGTTGGGDPTQVKVYKDADCSGSPAVTGTVAQFTGAGITVTVPENATTSLSARTTDAAGNDSICSNSISYTEDSTAPAAPTITATNPPSPANENHPKLKGDAPSDAITVRIYTDDPTCTGPVAASGEPAQFEGGGIEIAVADDRTTELRARALDAVGNVSSCSAPYAYTEDSTGPDPPAITATDPPSPANDNNPKAKGSAAADAVTVKLYADDSSCTDPAAASGTAEEFEGGGISVPVADDHLTQLRARAVDQAGNASGCSAPFAYTEDSTAPAAPTITATDPPSPANDNNPKAKGNAAADAVTVKLYADDSGCTDPAAASGTAEEFEGGGISVPVADDHLTQLRARAVDQAGNASGCSAPFAYTEDSTGPDPPAITATDPPSPANENHPKLKGDAPSDAITVRIYTDDPTCTGPVAASGEPAQFEGGGIEIAVADDRTTELRARALDAVGNVSSCSAPYAYTEDSTGPDPPAITATDPPSPANDNNPKAKGSAAADAVTVKLYADDSGCTDPAAASGTAEEFEGGGISVPVADDHLTQLRARAVDQAGNASGCSAPFAYTEDSTGPDPPAITAGPADPTNETTPEFAFSSDEGGASFECSLAGSAWAPCTSPHTIGPLSPDGNYSFRVRAVDRAGNAGTPSVRAFLLDTVPPTDPGSLSSPSHEAGVPSNDRTIDVVWSGASDDRSGVDGFSYEWSTNPGTIPDATKDAEEGPGAATSSALTDGSHWFHLRTRDNAGNWTSTAHLGPFLIDTVGPATTIDPVPSPTNDSTPTVSFRSEDGATFQCRVDAGEWGSCTSPATIQPPLSDGEHTFFVRATDRAGNLGAPAERVFRVDTAAPDTQITFGPSGITADPTPTFAFSADEPGTFECKLDSGSFGSCTSPRTLITLAEGAHAFQVRAIDQVGNADQTPATRGFTVDVPEPGSLAAWGVGSEGQTATPAGHDFTAVAAGGFHSLALRGNGSLAGWGYDYYGQATPPAGADFVAISAGQYHSLALRGNGSLAGWGDDANGQASVPAGSDFVAITAGGWHSLALRGNGSIAGWGQNADGQATPPAGSDFVAIAAGAWHSLALRGDGSIAGWGWNGNGQATPPAGSDFVAIAAGAYHSLALRSNGTIAAWGYNDYGQATPPPGNDFVAIAAGAYHSLALRADGTIVGWGRNDYGQATPPAGNDYFGVAAGNGHSLVLVHDTAGPDTTIDSGPALDPPNSNDPAFTFHSEAGATFECRLDGDAWAACTSPKAYTNVPDGTHTFWVRAIDHAGNPDPSPASRDFTIDTTPSDTTIDSGPSGLTNDNDPAFSFHSSEPGSTFECRLDGAPWTSCSSSKTYTDDRRRLAHLLGARDRRRGQHRPKPREQLLHRRRDPAKHHDLHRSERAHRQQRPVIQLRLRLGCDV